MNRRQLVRSSSLLAVTAALAACGNLDNLFSGGRRTAQATHPAQPTTPTGPAPRGAGRIALLVPLSGSNAAIGSALEQATKLGLDNAAILDVRDTASTPAGAEAAAAAAIADGADLILGPLTAAETAPVARLAQEAGVCVLAFTSDSTQARPGVWPLGYTPLQQMRRLTVAAQAAGKTSIAALVPDNELGRAMAAAMQLAAPAAGMTVVNTVTYGASFNELSTAVRDISNYSSRRGALDSRARALRARGDAAGRREAASLSGRGVGSAPFDVLVLAEGGNRLREIASLLPYYDVDSPNQVRLIGPGLWANDPNMGGEAALLGAWYAAPDPASRAEFVSRYLQAYGTEPARIADIAYDAAGIARVVAASGSFSPQNLSTPQGFMGASGLVVLQADGEVRRGLALFEVERRGARMIDAAPQTPAIPGT